MIHLVLDLPPSANKRIDRNHRLTPAARTYLEAAAWEAQRQMLEQGYKMATGRLEVTMRTYGWKGDLDNIAKLAQDCLNGVAFIDDNLIDRLVIERCKGGERRLEIDIGKRA